MTDLKIRSARPEDAGRLREIYAYYVVNTAVTFECSVPSEAEFRRRVEHVLERYPYLVLERGGTVIGYAYAGAFKEREAYAHTCEVSIYLAPEERRRGCGRMLYGALETELLARGIRNLYACIGNPVGEDPYLTRDSERFHERLGYVRVGEFHGCGRKFGRLYGIIWMEKILGDPEGTEAPGGMPCCERSDEP